MKVFFGGVRGSMPCSGPAFAAYGGHTTCVLVTGAGGERLLLDAGSGVQAVNPRLARPVPAGAATGIVVLLSHLHLDHVLGLPKLGALFRAGAEVRIVGPAPVGLSLQQALDRVFSPPLWPYSLAQATARVHIQELARADLDGRTTLLRHGGLTVRGLEVPHPGGGAAWRIEDTDGTSLVLATDLEWERGDAQLHRRFVELCAGPRPADLLVMDGQFSADELPRHRGWGHSSIAQCAEAAAAAGVARLLVTHHDPGNDDARLDTIARELHALRPGATLAREGLELELGGPAAADQGRQP